MSNENAASPIDAGPQPRSGKQGVLLSDLGRLITLRLNVRECQFILGVLASGGVVPRDDARLAEVTVLYAGDAKRLRKRLLDRGLIASDGEVDRIVGIAPVEVGGVPAGSEGEQRPLIRSGRPQAPRTRDVDWSGALERLLAARLHGSQIRSALAVLLRSAKWLQPNVRAEAQLARHRLESHYRALRAMQGRFDLDEWLDECLGSARRDIVQRRNGRIRGLQPEGTAQ